MTLLVGHYIAFLTQNKNTMTSKNTHLDSIFKAESNEPYIIFSKCLQQIQKFKKPYQAKNTIIKCLKKTPNHVKGIISVLVKKLEYDANPDVFH